MHKNALFFEKKKNGKIGTALGAPPPDLQSCYFHHHLLHLFFRRLL